MKDLVRMKSSLTEEAEQLLNKQIKMEAKSSSTYLAMASWCDRNGFQYSANFFYQQSEEERVHMMKIFRYINNAGGVAVSPEITDVPVDFDSFKSIFEQALDQEIDVTRSINQIVDSCHKLKDYTTANFLQWFLQEQLEEENTARRCLELFSVINEENQGKFFIDQQIGKLRNYSPEEA